jgi:prepilin-type N-terminal cleavage/methylation domain-containing protein
MSNSAHLKNSQKGFTLIELLVVIGVLAVLLAIVLIAINPARQFSQANNTKRASDVNAILNAVDQYAADNKGSIPVSITTTSQTISDAAADICSAIVPTYIAALPVDPLTNNGTAISTCSGTYTTGYTIIKSATDNRITVTAPAAELGAVIGVTR